MRRDDEYRLSQYEDLGPLDKNEHIRLKRHRIYGQICVEKKVSPEMETVYRFLREHPSPCIPHIYECIREEDRLILIEEYVQGRTVEEMTEERLFSEQETAEIMRKLCGALETLHNASPAIICRDIKASNVMMDAVGNVKIVDFDIARVYHAGKARDTKLLGTAEYAAPEQYGFFQTDNRTDIYALGVLMNYMLLKKFPVEKKAEGSLGPIIRKCTCLNPGDRYQNVEELRQEIETAVLSRGQEKTEKKPEAESLLPPGFRSKTPWKMVVAAAGYLFLTWFCFTLRMKNGAEEIVGLRLRMEQAAVWLSQMLFIALACNYRGIRDHFSILDQKNPVLKILLYAAADFLLLFIAAACIGIVESILF